MGEKGKKRGEKPKRHRRAKLADRWTYPSPDSTSARLARRFCFAFFPTLSRSKGENPGSKVAFSPNCGAAGPKLSLMIANVIQADKCRMKMSMFKQGLSTKVSFMYFIYISLPLVNMMYTCFDHTKKCSLFS